MLGIFLRYERDKQRTGIGRFSPIEVHDEAYRQIPLNLTKAAEERLFDRIVVYTRQANGQLQIGLDTADNKTAQINLTTDFERLRQPIFPRSFYHDQWLALSHLARQRGETDTPYVAQIAEFVQTFSQ